MANTASTSSTTTTAPTIPPIALPSARTAKIATLVSIGSLAGSLGGLYYAYKHKCGFWGHIGFAILGSVVVGSATGMVAGMVIKPEGQSFGYGV